MTRMFVRHRIKDYGTWRRAYDAFDTERVSLGVTGQQVFQSVDDPNDVTVWHDFATSNEARNFASSEKLKTVMQAAGVKGDPEIWLVNVVV